MIKRIKCLVIAVSLFLPALTHADEGMWLMMFIKRLNEADMQKEGLKLTAEEIYDVNHSSVKDAIVVLGGGFCTAEVVSNDGLMLTNHHCGYEAVQQHSTVEHDYLTDGFWAMNHNEELPNEGLTASFLVRMEDVGDKIKPQLSDTMSEETRTATIKKITDKLKEENNEKGRYKVDIKSFFNGNEFYMFVLEVFKDVRLVGAPPSAIGKFGGDTDNWMWPRQTGDFSMLRVYSDKDGKPAVYSKDNVPYHPKHFLPVSIAGIKKDDFAMIMGYPGKTDRYLTSAGVQLAIDQTNPAIVKIRTKKLELMKQDMNASDKIRIMYAAQYAKTSNYWKYFIGQTKGLKRLRTAEQKAALENQFTDWANSTPAIKAKYGNVVSEINSAYNDMRKVNLAKWYLQEAIFGTQILTIANSYQGLEKVLSNKEAKPEEIKAATEPLKEAAKEFYKEFNPPTDQKVFAALMEMYSKEVSKEQQAPLFAMVEKKFKGNYNEYAEEVFEHSMFANEQKLNDFLADPSLKKLKKDMAYEAVSEIYNHYVANVRPQVRSAQGRIDKNMRLFVDGLRQMMPEKKFYPDANSTMRLSYGTVEDYIPMDAARYDYYTTIDGIMEKMDNENNDFVVPNRLVELYKKKDYGRYGEGGTLKVNFLTTNDITGGNSGSPVINGKGELIGIAFDGNWEAMSGDIAYDEKLKRTICVDIRYVLWVIDKYAGAGYLVNEMKVVNGSTASN